MRSFIQYGLFILLLILGGCNSQTQEGSGALPDASEGKLFIIGGGKRPPEMIQTLLHAAHLDTSGAIFILPMSSEEPDTAVYYARQQFLEQGIAPDRILAYNFSRDSFPADQIEQLKSAHLIYLTGGDQTRFMGIVSESPVYEAIHQAYRRGAVIAGTSAGAAVMSRKMITGNAFKHPEYTGDFRTIESENIEIAEGLGLLPHAIVDQHFIYRMRMNRLITAVIEHPEAVCIGIDESTAILVEGDSARVIGNWQVVVLRNPTGKTRVQNGLLGAEGLELSVFLPGDVFSLGVLPLK